MNRYKKILCRICALLHWLFNFLLAALCDILDGMVLLQYVFEEASVSVHLSPLHDAVPWFLNSFLEATEDYKANKDTQKTTSGTQ